MSLDPTGLYWLLPLASLPPSPAGHDEPSDPRGMLTTISTLGHHPLLLTILLALPCNVQPWQPSSLPSSSSTSRQLEVTAGGSIRGDLLLSLPLSFLLPTIGFNTEFKREAGAGPGSVRNVGRREDSGPGSPAGRERIDFLFQILHVEDEGCKQRAICEIVQSKLLFSPLSDFLISVFRKSTSNFLEADVNSSVEWERYFYSSFIGQNSKDENICQKTFSQCPLRAEQLVNIPVLKLWQLLAHKISIRIDDE